MFEVSTLPGCTSVSRQMGHFYFAQPVTFQLGCNILCIAGARYFEVRLLLENNELSNEKFIVWERFTRNFHFGNGVGSTARPEKRIGSSPGSRRAIFIHSLYRAFGRSRH